MLVCWRVRFRFRSTKDEVEIASVSWTSGTPKVSPDLQLDYSQLSTRLLPTEPGRSEYERISSTEVEKERAKERNGRDELGRVSESLILSEC